MQRLKNANPVVSFNNLRRSIGILGMALPAVCYLGGALFYHVGLQPSISHYYYTNVRDAFVGLLIGLGMFLTAYNGYERIDSVVSKVTGGCGLGIAIFPCLLSARVTEPVGFFQLAPKVSDALHLSFAGAFFLLLAINSIFIFTLNRGGAVTNQKKKRNAIYIACGLAIILSMAALLYIKMTMDPALVDQKHLVFILETAMLESFGISWLVKGQTILRDEETRSSFTLTASRRRPA